jgi:hypothetical protein
VEFVDELEQLRNKLELVEAVADTVDDSMALALVDNIVVQPPQNRYLSTKYLSEPAVVVVADVELVLQHSPLDSTSDKLVDTLLKN